MSWYLNNWKMVLWLTWISHPTLKWCHMRDIISHHQVPLWFKLLTLPFVSLCKYNKAVIRVLDPGSGTGLGYVRPSQNLTTQYVCVWWWVSRVCVCVCVGRWSQLIPWESVVSLDHLWSSQGRGVAPVSHQADDRRLRALHAALISAMIASLHRPYLCFIYSLSDNNKCLLSAILNYIFISLLTNLKHASIVCGDFKSMWHLLPRSRSL